MSKNDERPPKRALIDEFPLNRTQTGSVRGLSAMGRLVPLRHPAKQPPP